MITALRALVGGEGVKRGGKKGGVNFEVKGTSKERKKKGRLTVQF